MKGTDTTIQSKAYGFPQILADIPDPPAQIHVRSRCWPQILQQPAVAVVGSRKVSSYGRAATGQLVRDLVRAGICIVSGLAIGVDAIAHRAALEAKGTTIAVLATGLDMIYPSVHHQLAEDIVQQGGALITEYEAGSTLYRSRFVARNRLVSGLSQLTLITEAAKKSGTLHTASFALEQGRDVAAVPGPITSPTSQGTNQLIKTGALLVSDAGDILQALGIKPDPKTSAAAKPAGETPAQQTILSLLQAGISDGATLLQRSQMPTNQFNQTITMLEIAGDIVALGNNHWAVHQ